MKKKLLAFLMAVTMVFAMAPLTAGVAFADDENIDAAGAEVTEPVIPDVTAETVAGPNAKALPEGCLFYIGDKQVTGTTAKGKGWSFKYKNGTGYLTLNKANITKTSTIHFEQWSEDASFGIYASGMKLKITLKGKNKVITPDANVALSCAEALTLSGKGSLTAQGLYVGIGCQGKVTIKNATVTSKDNYSYGTHGLRAEELSLSKAKLTVKGSSGLSCTDELTATNSILTVTCNDGYNAVTPDHLTLKSSRLTAIGTVKVDTINLVNLSKGKYSTRLEATGNIYPAAVYVMEELNGRIITPEGGAIGYWQGGRGVVDENGDPADHVVLAPKKANSLKIKAKTATVKYSLLSVEDQTLAVSKVIKFVKKGQGELSYEKVSGNESITVDGTTGEVKVASGLKKGTYKVKIKVTAAGDENYKSATKTVKVTIKVK